MLYENTIYTENEAIRELVDTAHMYTDRVFNIRKIPIEGDRSHLFYTCILRNVNVNGNIELKFIILFDEDKQYFLDKFETIDGYEVAEFTIVGFENGYTDYDPVPCLLHFMPLDVRLDYANRETKKDNNLSIIVNSGTLLVDDWQCFTLVHQS